jgi:hypothetical protein
LAPRKGIAKSVAQDRAEHLRIEEAAAVEQRKHEVRPRIREQHIEGGRDLQFLEQAFQDHPHLVMIGRMVAVHAVEPAAAQGVLGDKQQLEVAPYRGG